jgi:hypothetical protein
MFSGIYMNRLFGKGKNHLWGLVFLWIVITLIVTLSPFNFTFNNSVTTPAEGGLHFQSPSIAYIHLTPATFGEIRKFTIVTEAKPDGSEKKYNGILFGYCYDHFNYNFYAMQAGKDFTFFITHRSGLQRIFVRDIFEWNQSVRIAITYDGEKIRVIKNGQVQEEVTAKNLDFSSWNISYPLVLANSGMGWFPWSGTIYSLDIFDYAIMISNSPQNTVSKDQTPPLLSLSFHHIQTRMNSIKADAASDSLVIPALLLPPVKGLFSHMHYLLETKRWNLRDFILNFLWFMPFGLLLKPLLDKITGRNSLNFWLTFTAGFALTITIESLQVLLPIRNTSITDVLFNTLGTLAGSFLSAIPWIRKSSIL